MSFDLPAGGDLIGKGDEGVSGKWSTIQQKNLPEIAANFRLFSSANLSAIPEMRLRVKKVAAICGKLPGNFFLKEFPGAVGMDGTDAVDTVNRGGQCRQFNLIQAIST